MIHAENSKVVVSLPTGVVGATATQTLTVDRLGYDHVSVVAMRASNASTVFATVLKVEESDNNSDYTDVTAFVGDGAGGFTIPAVSDTNSAAAVKMDIDCKAKKRYLKVSMTPGATAVVSLVAHASRAEVYPASATDVGVIGWVKG